LKLGQARGAAICGTVDSKAGVFEYATRQIKQAVVGSGNAEKAQVQLMMRSILKLDGPVAADAADALAAAVCHALRGRVMLLQAGLRDDRFSQGPAGDEAAAHADARCERRGLRVGSPMSTFYGLPSTGEAVALFTHLVVREDAHILFGFGTEAERRLFRGLLKVSGVGPKIALGILSGASVEDFLRTIEAEDVGMLTRIPGIGRKTAERIIIEMRDSVQKLSMPALAGNPLGPGVMQSRKARPSARWLPWATSRRR